MIVISAVPVWLGSGVTVTVRAGVEVELTNDVAVDGSLIVEIDPTLAE